MRILVTGSTGLIGTAVCAHLTVEGHEIVRYPPFEYRNDLEVQSPSARRLDVKKRFSEELIIGFLREAEAIW